MHNATTLELNAAVDQKPPAWLPTTNNQASLTKKGLRGGSKPDPKSLCGRVAILSRVVTYNFLKTFLGCPSRLKGGGPWLFAVVRVVLYNPPLPASLESQVWTIGPNSNTWFLAASFQPFSVVFGAFFWTGVPLLPLVILIPWAGAEVTTKMAYRVIRMKKEARRNTKLDEIFQVSSYF